MVVKLVKMETHVIHAERKIGLNQMETFVNVLMVHLMLLINVLIVLRDAKFVIILQLVKLAGHKEDFNLLD